MTVDGQSCLQEEETVGQVLIFNCVVTRARAKTGSQELLGSCCPSSTRIRLAHRDDAQHTPQREVTYYILEGIVEGHMTGFKGDVFLSVGGFIRE